MTEEKVGFDALITFHKSIDFYKLISKFKNKSVLYTRIQQFTNII